MELSWWWTALSLASTGVTGSSTMLVQANTGEDVILPCACPDISQELFLVWQLNMKIVMLHPRNHSEIDESYQNRTHLNLETETKNCSLLLSGVRLSDMGVYQCYYKARALREISVTLKVNEKQSQEGIQESTSTTVTMILMSLSMVGLLGLVYVLVRHWGWSLVCKKPTAAIAGTGDRD
ncbi:hypothetical protein ACEWY4_001964 [Coilia grayii]|uniref:Ig-like domain-containing protein n=1 Tax=Coilia grayii TaxID=363190 RepID=A0ABD1KV07_9TELE